MSFQKSGDYDTLITLYYRAHSGISLSITNILGRILLWYRVKANTKVDAKVTTMAQRTMLKQKSLLNIFLSLNQIYNHINTKNIRLFLKLQSIWGFGVLGPHWDAGAGVPGPR